MKKNLILCAGGAMLALSAASVSAQTDAYGVYVGAGVSMSKRSGHYGLPDGVEDKTGKYRLTLPGRLFAGYEFNDNWALEGGRTVFTREKFGLPGPAGGTDVDMRGSALYLAGKYSMRLGEKWRAFGKAGLSRTTVRVESSRFSIPGGHGKITNDGMYFGAGAEYAITPKAGVVVEYENVNKLKADGGHSGAISISGRYSF